jgi:hypothetical protein
MIEIHKIVIWGLRKKYHTHRYIHKAFYENAKKLGYNVIWVEDEKENAKYIEPGDLIISAEPVGKMVPEKFTFEEYNLPVRNDVWYCLHNFKDVFKNRIQSDRFINLAVYQSKAEQIPNIERWGTATFFDRQTRTLYQPWGTDLLAEEFKKPTFHKGKFVFWIGSIWNNTANQGNKGAIAELKSALHAHALYFVHLRFIPDWLNVFFVRHSRIAPAIAGKYQTEIDYLPCRMFKNISYGQLGITNVAKFKDILGKSFIEGKTMDALLEKSLSLSKEEYKNIVRAQQEIIKNYTYKQSIENIIKALTKN